ncbi:hypothetical protein EL17_18480 [Anditalea andensis]|uniref:Uncharacterized protein n=1 Tax=Anditalea andensis TaxID=1048983 RepID=A0A074KUZ7_9BACT|nr:hypothetical protein [Anditalea andensis]KEO72719.1 hypothetical protein EL17_18480 [Anditalea andensis]
MAGRGESNLGYYSHDLAKPVLHFKDLPTQVDSEQIIDYLYLVKQQHSTPSGSYFKFTVYALRLAYRMEGLKDNLTELPSIRRGKRLPVVLSREEVRKLLKAPKLLWSIFMSHTQEGSGLKSAGQALSHGQVSADHEPADVPRQHWHQAEHHQNATAGSCAPCRP